MSLAYFIVPERSVPGLDCFVNGKSLAHVDDGLVDRLCREAGVRPLSEFFSENPYDAAQLGDEHGGDPPPDGFPPEEWFAAADGLRTVRALQARTDAILAVGPADAAAGVSEDLREYEVVLCALERAGVRWHLAIDF